MSDVLNSLKASINKNIKGLHCEIMSNSTIAETKEWISLPTYDLNRIVSGSLVRGVPSKSLTLLVGQEHTFKSSLMVNMARLALKQDYTPIIIDTEGGITNEFCKRWGLDTSKVLYNYTPWGEQIRGILGQLMESEGSKFCIILDSIGGIEKLKAADDAKAGEYKQDMGGNARIIKSIMKLIANIVKSQNSIGILSSHFCSQSGSVPLPDSVIGGKAVLLLPDIILYLKKASKTDTEKINTDKLINVASVKNRFYPADKIGHVLIDYSQGLDMFGGLIDIAKDTGVLEQKGSWVYVNGEKVAQGIANFQAVLKEDKEMQSVFIEKINEYLKTTEYSTLEEKEQKEEIQAFKEGLLNTNQNLDKEDDEEPEIINTNKKSLMG
jgi:recombination protein RecA